ncbi:MAG: response regulator transcription factor [Actinobacteria bacterium]|nr:response regulator transcription factor [Actinomycetota bacterium]
MPTIRVLIVDDHEMVAEGLRDALARHEDIQVVGGAGSARRAVELAAELRPDVVLMDYRLPDGDGASTAKRIRAGAGRPAVVMVTASDHDSVVAAAVQAGCSGYVTKDRAVGEVVVAVRAAARGELTFPVEVLTRLVPRAGDQEASTEALSPRERQVLRLVAEGRSTDDIATDLVLSPHTVRNHVQRTLRKLGAHSKLEAVNTAVQHGIIDYPG